jgi:hypothetical protein
MAICLSNCFSERTNVTVLKDGVSNRKNIADVKKGDIVATLKDGTAGWTTVSRNLKTEGEVEFLQITTRSLKTGNYNEIEVTPQHGLVLSNVHNTLTIDSAKHIEIGDHLLGVNNEVLVVVDISTHTMNAKHTLETSDGTVFASDLFTTTLCNDEVAGGERLFDPTMNDWRMRHNFSNTP